jgi:uncharacterized membrane protein
MMLKERPNYWNPYDRAIKMELRRYFVLKLLNGAMCGLVHMHNHDRLHQSLGPSSVVLKYSASSFFTAHSTVYYSFSILFLLAVTFCYLALLQRKMDIIYFHSSGIWHFL